MLWVIQENLWNEGSDLAEICREEKLPHLLVKVVPFSDSVRPGGTLIPEPPDSEKAIIAFGSTSMMRIAKKRLWVPGIYHDDKNFDFRTWLVNIPREYILNFDHIISDMSVSPSTLFPPRFFVRPCGDFKLFSGGVMTREGFQHWKAHVYLIESETDLKPTTPIVLSSVKEIQEEVRFYVVKKAIVTASTYRVGGQIVKAKRENHDVCARQFVYDLTRFWNPAPAYCVDVALHEGKWKLIEYNTLNACGFYGCDMRKVVKAIAEMEA